MNIQIKLGIVINKDIIKGYSACSFSKYIDGRLIGKKPRVDVHSDVVLIDTLYEKGDVRLIIEKSEIVELLNHWGEGSTKTRLHVTEGLIKNIDRVEFDDSVSQEDRDMILRQYGRKPLLPE